MRSLWSVPVLLFAVGCGPGPNRMELALAPDLIASTIGTLGATATVYSNKDSTSGVHVAFDVAYKDRNGVPHTIAGISDATDVAGQAKASFAGLIFEGSGTVTAKALDSQGAVILDDMKNPLQATATFGVLDLSPPQVAITSPANGAHFAMNAQYTITVRATDEIGVSQVYTQTSRSNGGTGGNASSSRITSGAADVTVRVDADTGGNPTNTITIYAMAADLSGNLGVAPPVVINVP
ncbi:MAG: hypothetical protein JNJ46_08820 [Myxococcales bacterium]|nr:hypothetical protein [Myxococcales bacterium]